MGTKLNTFFRNGENSIATNNVQRSSDRIYGREQQQNAVHHKQKYATGDIAMKRKEVAWVEIYNVALL